MLARLKVIPPRAPHESEEDFKARLSPDQVALNDWMNHAYAERERRTSYCNPT